MISLNLSFLRRNSINPFPFALCLQRYKILMKNFSELAGQEDQYMCQQFRKLHGGIESQIMFYLLWYTNSNLPKTSMSSVREPVDMFPYAAEETLQMSSRSRRSLRQEECLDYPGRTSVITSLLRRGRQEDLQTEGDVVTEADQSQKDLKMLHSRL